MPKSRTQNCTQRAIKCGSQSDLTYDDDTLPRFPSLPLPFSLLFLPFFLPFLSLRSLFISSSSSLSLLPLSSHITLYVFPYSPLPNPLSSSDSLVSLSPSFFFSPFSLSFLTSPLRFLSSLSLPPLSPSSSLPICFHPPSLLYFLPSFPSHLISSTSFPFLSLSSLLSSFHTFLDFLAYSLPLLYFSIRCFLPFFVLFLSSSHLSTFLSSLLSLPLWLALLLPQLPCLLLSPPFSFHSPPFPSTSGRMEKKI